MDVLNPRTYGQPQPSRTLLHGFSGTLDGGEMLLVIGKPGSGCTTFLKTLANMRGEYKATSGRLDYGGRPIADDDPDPVRVTYCGMPTCVCLDDEAPTELLLTGDHRGRR